jgi:hypothetical protein
MPGVPQVADVFDGSGVGSVFSFLLQALNRVPINNSEIIIFLIVMI